MKAKALQLPDRVAEWRVKILASCIWSEQTNSGKHGDSENNWNSKTVFDMVSIWSARNEYDSLLLLVFPPRTHHQKKQERPHSQLTLHSEFRMCIAMYVSWWCVVVCHSFHLATHISFGDAFDFRLFTLSCPIIITVIIIEFERRGDEKVSPSINAITWNRTCRQAICDTLTFIFLSLPNVSICVCHKRIINNSIFRLIRENFIFAFAIYLDLSTADIFRFVWLCFCFCFFLYFPFRLHVYERMVSL